MLFCGKLSHVSLAMILKSEYDAENEDRMIEYIVMQIETGSMN